MYGYCILFTLSRQYISVSNTSIILINHLNQLDKFFGYNLKYNCKKTKLKKQDLWVQDNHSLHGVSLSAYLRQSSSLNDFKKQLKTYFVHIHCGQLCCFTMCFIN